MTFLSASAIRLTIASVGDNEGLFEIAKPPTWFAGLTIELPVGSAPLDSEGPFAAGGISPLEPPMLGGACPGIGVTFDGGRPGIGAPGNVEPGSGVPGSGAPGMFCEICPIMSGNIPGGIPCPGIP